MDEKFVRTGLLLGEDGLLRLKMSRVTGSSNEEAQATCPPEAHP